MVGNVVAIHQFIVATLFDSVGYVKNLLVGILCTIGVCQTETLQPPAKQEDLYSLVLNNSVEYGTAVLLWIAAFLQNLVSIVFGAAIWLFNSSFFQVSAFVIIVSLAILKLFKVIMQRRSSNRSESVPPLHDMSLNVNPDHVPENVMELPPASPRITNFNIN
ncbi:unnamed protein product, partial [Larinioides sclopetarius]